MTRRILFVDDEPALRLTLKSILEKNGYEVVTAASSTDARLRLGSERYDLVITDLKMEHERAGFEVIRFARAQSYRPAVVILTSYVDLGTDWKKQGADGLVIKPTNAPELLEFIEALLARQQITTWREKKASTVIKPSGATS